MTDIGLLWKRVRLNSDAHGALVGKLRDAILGCLLPVIGVTVKLRKRGAQPLKLRHERAKTDLPLFLGQTFNDQSDPVVIGHESHHNANRLKWILPFECVQVHKPFAGGPLIRPGTTRVLQKGVKRRVLIIRTKNI